MTGTLNPPIPVIGQLNSIEDPVVKESLEKIRDGLNAILASDNTVDPALFNTANKIKFKCYEPKAIATEESRTNTAFGTLTTADEITNVVVPENGKILIAYSAIFKSSGAGLGRAAIFIGGTQLRSGAEGISMEAPTSGTEFRRLITRGESGLAAGFTEAAFPSTGSSVQSTEVFRLNAGTYNISIQFKSSSGSVTVKERLLQVAVIG